MRFKVRIYIKQKAYDAFYTKRIRSFKKDNRFYQTVCIHLSHGENKRPHRGALLKLINSYDCITIAVGGRFHQLAKGYRDDKQQ